MDDWCGQDDIGAKYGDGQTFVWLNWVEAPSWVYSYDDCKDMQSSDLPRNWEPVI